MRLFPRFLLIPFFLFLVSATAWAAPKSTPSPTPGGVSSQASEEAAYTKQLTDYYRKDGEYRKAAWAKRTELMKETTELRKKLSAEKNPKEKEKISKQVGEANRKLGTLAEEMAKNDVVTAEFALKAAQRRVEKTKETYARIQEVNKKAGKP